MGAANVQHRIGISYKLSMVSRIQRKICRCAPLSKVSTNETLYEDVILLIALS